MHCKTFISSLPVKYSQFHSHLKRNLTLKKRKQKSIKYEAIKISVFTLQSQCCQTGAGTRHIYHTKLKPMVNPQISLPHRPLGQQCRNLPHSPIRITALLPSFPAAPHPYMSPAVPLPSSPWPCACLPPGRCSHGGGSPPGRC